MNDASAITNREYWNAKFGATEELVYTDTVNRFVKELTEGLKPGKMIDLAGGEGRNAVYFAENKWQAENIDISNVGLTKFLKFAEERGVSEKVFANCADATGFESVLTPVDIGVVAYLQVPQQDLADALDTLVEKIQTFGGRIEEMSPTGIVAAFAVDVGPTLKTSPMVESVAASVRMALTASCTWQKTRD